MPSKSFFGRDIESSYEELRDFWVQPLPWDDSRFQGQWSYKDGYVYGLSTPLPPLPKPPQVRKTDERDMEMFGTLLQNDTLHTQTRQRCTGSVLPSEGCGLINHSIPLTSPQKMYFEKHEESATP